MEASHFHLKESQKLSTERHGGQIGTLQPQRMFNVYSFTMSINKPIGILFTKPCQDFNTILRLKYVLIVNRSFKNRRAIGSSARSHRRFGEMTAASRRKRRGHFGERSVTLRRNADAFSANFRGKIGEILASNQ